MIISIPYTVISNAIFHSTSPYIHPFRQWNKPILKVYKGALPWLPVILGHPSLVTKTGKNRSAIHHLYGNNTVQFEVHISDPTCSIVHMDNQHHPSLACPYSIRMHIIISNIYLQRQQKWPNVRLQKKWFTCTILLQ